MSQGPDPINCASGCKRTVPDMDAALQAAWEYLQITGRWRCPECRRELQRVNKPGEHQRA